LNQPALFTGGYWLASSPEVFAVCQRSDGAQKKIWTSDDLGYTWTLHTITTSADYIDKILFVEDIFIACCLIGGTIVTASASGASWTERSTGPSIELNQGVFALGKYILPMGESGSHELWISDDGITWTNDSGNLDGLGLTGVHIAASSGLVACVCFEDGDAGCLIMTTTDLATWTHQRDAKNTENPDYSYNFFGRMMNMFIAWNIDFCSFSADGVTLLSMMAPDPVDGLEGKTWIRIAE
ncbi:MAG: hypothetical protein ABI778_08085, partial [Ignavibacteriota bacterium]